MTDPVLVDRRGAAAAITIDRADRRNALSPEVIHALADAILTAERDPEVRVAILSGAGDRSFSAGGDLGQMSGEGAIARHRDRAALGELLNAMRASRLPLVARVNGHALGGGFGLMLACDLVVAADDVELGTPEIDVGLWPFVITAMIQRDIPRKLALELMLTGRRLPARDAATAGFVNRVVPRAELDAAVDEVVTIIASKSPLIVELGKRSFYRAEDLRFEDAVEYLTGMLSLCIQSEDTIEGVTAFLEKRTPRWQGR